jgi:hypothetical protein
MTEPAGVKETVRSAYVPGFILGILVGAALFLATYGVVVWLR